MHKESKITLVTAIYDIGRSEIGSMARSFDHYLEKFAELVSIPYNFVVYTDRQTKERIQSRFGVLKNVVFVDREIEAIYGSNDEIFNLVNEIRQDPKWQSRAGWLPDSPQCKLKYYNPLVMSKMFLLNDARIYNFFASTYFFWIDAGITQTVSINYLRHIEKVPRICGTNVLFLAFPYQNSQEIHGFEKNAMDQYAGKSVDLVCRGGFFGGNYLGIEEANKQYYELLNRTVKDGFVGTEESIFTLMAYISPQEYRVAKINEDGLIYKFFDDLDNDNTRFLGDIGNYIKETKTSIYVLAFEAPDQLNSMLGSFFSFPKFLSEPRKILIDNSESVNHSEEYKRIADKFGFEYIKKNNIGICGARQFVAEHFEESDSDFYIFFEDDMHLDVDYGRSRNGFEKRVDKLWDVMHNVMQREKFDFLKLTFDEFYGDNTKQWAFMNVSQETREKYWPGKVKSVMNLPDCDFSSIKRIKICENKCLTYAVGEVYYCNWPLLFSREGSKKLFIDKKFEKPYEQMWMERNFLLQKEGRMKTGVLLCSPIKHDRKIHYKKEQRKEN